MIRKLQAGSEKRQKRKLSLPRVVRKPSPNAEELLWDRLREDRLMGFKFTRQQLIDTHVVDFCCLSGNLIVEIDTPSREIWFGFDYAREKDLFDMGYRILRFSKQEIIDDLSWVENEISDFLVKDRLQL